MLREAHDALFRVLARDRTSAPSLIRRYAPTDLVQLLSDAPPKLLKGTLVPPGRGKLQADAIFEVQLRGGEMVLVHILFEHLSGPGHWTPLKLLDYMAATWRRVAGTRAVRSLVPIVPVAICHGPRHIPVRFWNWSTSRDHWPVRLGSWTFGSRSMTSGRFRAWSWLTIPRPVERLPP